MRFFRRKRSDETERCPRCSEPVPEGAAECMMCGLPLEPFRAALSSEEAETQTADRPNRMSVAVWRLIGVSISPSRRIRPKPS
jgi:hypothetical protein